MWTDQNFRLRKTDARPWVPALELLAAHYLYKIKVQLKMSVTRYCQAGHKFIIDGEMAVGNTITVTVEPAEGYEFISWSDGYTNATRTIYIDHCGEVYTARFSSSVTPPPPPDTYRITVSASPSNGGTASGGGSYQSGASVTITATANTDYQFTNWTKGGTVVSSNPTYSFTATENAAYVAHFSGGTPTLSYKWISYGQTSSDASALSDINNYTSGTSSTVNLNNKLYCHVGFIIPTNSTISGSYKDALQQTINLSFTQLQSPPVTVDSGFKYMYASTGGIAPSGYSNANVSISL